MDSSSSNTQNCVQAAYIKDILHSQLGNIRKINVQDTYLKIREFIRLFYYI